MISDLLLAADLVDAVANPFRTIEEHETGASRLSVLAVLGARIDVVSLESATIADIDVLSGYVWRWAINESKQTSSEDPGLRLPQHAVMEGLFFSETDRLGRLLLLESVLTHPEAEEKFARFEESSEPVPLEQLPNVWPRDHLSRLSQDAESETESRQPDANLTELGMLLLQIATPAAIALLGGTILGLRNKGRENHPLLGAVQASIAAADEDLAQRLGLRRRFDEST